MQILDDDLAQMPYDIQLPRHLMRHLANVGAVLLLFSIPALCFSIKLRLDSYFQVENILFKLFALSIPVEIVALYFLYQFSSNLRRGTKHGNDQEVQTAFQYLLKWLSAWVAIMILYLLPYIYQTFGF